MIAVKTPIKKRENTSKKMKYENIIHSFTNKNKEL